MFLIVELIDGYRHIGFYEDNLTPQNLEFKIEIKNRDILKSIKYYFKIFDDDFKISCEKLTFYAFLKAVFSDILIFPHESWYYYYDNREQELSPKYIFDKTQVEWLKYETNIEKYFIFSKLFIKYFPYLNPDKITNYACNNFTSVDRQKLYFKDDTFYVISDYIVRIEKDLALTEKGYLYHKNKLINNYNDYDNFFIFEDNIYFISGNNLYSMTETFNVKSFTTFDQISLFTINTFDEYHQYESLMLTKKLEKINIYFRNKNIQICIKCLNIRSVMFNEDTFYIVDSKDKMYVVKKQGDTYLVVRKENIYNCFNLISLIDNDVVIIRDQFLFYRNHSYLLPPLYLQNDKCIFSLLFYNKTKRRLVGLTKNKAYFFFVNKTNIIILENYDNFQYPKLLNLTFKFDKEKYKMLIKKNNLNVIKNFTNLSESDKFGLIGDLMKNSFETVKFSYLSRNEICGEYYKLYEKLSREFNTFGEYI